jgi:hypothetical protein
MQMMMTGFLGKTKTRVFMEDLWNVLAEAQENEFGIPQELIELKKIEMQKKKVKTTHNYYFFFISNT